MRAKEAIRCLFQSALAILILGSFCIRAYCADQLALTENGKARSVIVIGEKATSVEQFAAKELQKYIEKMSGAALPIRYDDEKIKGNCIIIGRRNTNKITRKLGIKTGHLKEDGFIIKTVNNNLIISGSNNRGTLFGVYDFLEDDLGCLFFLNRWEVVPEKPTIKVGTIDRTEEPDFRRRGRWMCYPHSVDQQTKLKANWVQSSTVARWDNQLYIGSKVDFIKPSSPQYGGAWNYWYNKYVKLKKERDFILCSAYHTFEYFLAPEKYFKEHPEYFSLIDGKRVSGVRNKNGFLTGTQICWSNPDAVKEVTKNVLEFIKKYPDTDEIIVGGNDLGSFCECEKCLALETGKRSISGHKLCRSRGYALFLNKIVEEVKKHYPEKIFVHAAYSEMVDPPDNVEILKTSMISLAIGLRDFAHPINDPFAVKGTIWKIGSYQKVIEGWAKLSSNVIILEYYYGSGRKICIGIPTWPVLFKEYPYFKKIGIAGLGIPGDGPFSVDLTSYVGYRLLWDCHDEVLNNFCAKSFGKAAGPMRKYLDILGEITEKQDYGIMNHNASMIKVWSTAKKEVQSAEKCLKQAKNLVKGDKEILKRIKFVEKGFYFSSFIGTGYRLSVEGQKAISDKDYKKAKELFQLSIDNYRKASRYHHGSSSSALKYLENGYIKQSVQNLKLSEALMRAAELKQEIPNIASNPSAEKFREEERAIALSKDGGGNEREIRRVNPPVGWNIYRGTSGSFCWGTSEEAHTGKRSAFVDVTKLYESKDGKKSIYIALVQGNSRGYRGKKAYKATPNQLYHVTFWMKGSCPIVRVQALMWNSEEAAVKDRQYIHIKTITPTSEWKQYTGVFTTKKDTKKFVLLFFPSTLGKIYVDDVYIAPMKDIAEQKKIAIYNSDIDGGDTYGKTAILSTLVNAEGFQPEFITDLSLKNLLQHDCLIIPGVKKLGKSQINSSWVKNIREYVIKYGKGVLFQHDSCGYKMWKNIIIFPEICKGVKGKTGAMPVEEGSNKEYKRLIVSAIHPLTKGYKIGDEGSHTYWDHMALFKGKKGEVILIDKNKDPVVIAGRIGKGKVVFDGTTPYDEKTEAEVGIITGIEKDILINSINWFCE